MKPDLVAAISNQPQEPNQAGQPIQRPEPRLKTQYGPLAALTEEEQQVHMERST